jgi:hypothetical protein
MTVSKVLPEKEPKHDPPDLTRHAVARSFLFELHGEVGNQAMQHLLRSGFIQAKLAISYPDDPEEREADNVASTIMRKAAGGPCSCSAGEEMCEECQQKQSAPAIQRRATSPTALTHVSRIVSDVLRSSGHPLDSATLGFFEPRFGRDFSQVRVHTDADAAASARSIHAHAYTAGPDIVFAPGQYSPATTSGRSLLAHELTHVLQQRDTKYSGLLQRKPETCDPHEDDRPWLGRIRGTYSAALRRTPFKNPNDPHAGTLADIDEGDFVTVVGHEGGWLRARAFSGKKEIEGYISHELVVFDRWDLEPEAVKTGLTMREALVILKRAEVKKDADKAYVPTCQEKKKIDAAILTVKKEPKYQVDETTYHVSFVRKAGAKIKISTIEDFVLFVEAVEAQYPNASAEQVVSEIRQLWFSDVNWEVLVASQGIKQGDQYIDIESAPNPIADMFDMADLAPAAASKIIKTRMGDVNIGHVMAGIDARLSGSPTTYPKKFLSAQKHDKGLSEFKYESLKEADMGDPTMFATFTGDLGQAYAIFLFDRYVSKDPNAKLLDYMNEFAKPEELLGDLQGYIASAVAADVRKSGASPTGTQVKASSIVRDMYLVDKSSATPGVDAYLETVSGKTGDELKKHIFEDARSFASLWYAKLALENSTMFPITKEDFTDATEEFWKFSEEYETMDDTGDTLSASVDRLLRSAASLHW